MFTFYKELNLADNFETRAMLIFFHLAIILKCKKDDNNKKILQNLFDNIFHNIEVNIRELGYGDTKVNITMKTLSKIFYDIIVKLDSKEFTTFKKDSYLLSKYFHNKTDFNKEKTDKLANYYDEFNNFCFDLDIDNVLKGLLNFKFR